MKPVQHVVVSSVLAAGLYAVLRSWEASVATVLSGVFIDCDHLLDYLIEAGPRFRPRDFFDFYENRGFKKTRLLWHGWEWVPVLLVASALSGWHPILIGVLVFCRPVIKRVKTL